MSPYGRILLSNGDLKCHACGDKNTKTKIIILTVNSIRAHILPIGRGE